MCLLTLHCLACTSGSRKDCAQESQVEKLDKIYHTKNNTFLCFNPPQLMNVFCLNIGNILVRLFYKEDSKKSYRE